MSWVTVILCWLSLKFIQCFVACMHFLCTLMQFGMRLTVDHATTHPKSPSWKKGTRDGILRFLVDPWSNVLRYLRPLHPCIFSHCENTAHGKINWPFASASKLAAVLCTSLKYCLIQTRQSAASHVCPWFRSRCAHITVGGAMKKGRLAAWPTLASVTKTRVFAAKQCRHCTPLHLYIWEALDV